MIFRITTFSFPLFVLLFTSLLRTIFSSSSPPPTSPQTLQECIRQYKLSDRLAKGANGVVYRIVGEPQLVAKVITDGDADLSSNSVFLRNLKVFNAFLSSTQGKHKNIVMAECWTKLDGRPAFILPFYVDKDLSTFAQSTTKTQWPENQRKSTYRQMINGLYQLHSLRFHHGDIKPENFLKANATVALSDFDGTVPFGEPTPIFTQQYAAPEYAMNVDETYSINTGAADWYSLGASIYKLENNEQYNGDIRKLQHIGSAEFTDLLQNLLTHDPHKRNWSADINVILQHPYFSTLPSVEDEYVTLPDPKDVKEKKRSKTIFIIIIIIVLAALIVGAISCVYYKNRVKRPNMNPKQQKTVAV